MNDSPPSPPATPAQPVSRHDPAKPPERKRQLEHTILCLLLGFVAGAAVGWLAQGQGATIDQAQLAGATTGALLFLLLWCGYVLRLPGLGFYTPKCSDTGTESDTANTKTLWDWMQLLFVPIALAGWGFWFTANQANINRQNQTRQDNDLAQTQYAIRQQDLLTGYENRITDLVLSNKLYTQRSRPRDLEQVLQSIVHQAFGTVGPPEEPGQLDPKLEKGPFLRFLAGALLISNPTPIIDLQGTLIDQAQVQGVSLFDDHLQGVSLNGADLTGADLFKTDFRSADLQNAVLNDPQRADNAQFNNAHLEGAHMRSFFAPSQIYFNGAYLHKADLSCSNLNTVDFSDAHLDGAMIPANLRALIAVTSGVQGTPTWTSPCAGPAALSG